ncbi:MAG: hypothetical protein PVSMB10_16920 [Pseudarthrobacter sp.]
MDGDCYLRRPALIRMRAQLIADHLLPSAHSGLDPSALVVSSQTPLNRAAEQGANLGAITVVLMRLLERYGAAAMQDAIAESVRIHRPSVLRRLGVLARPWSWEAGGQLDDRACPWRSGCRPPTVRPGADIDLLN